MRKEIFECSLCDDFYGDGWTLVEAPKQLYAVTCASVDGLTLGNSVSAISNNKAHICTACLEHIKGAKINMESEKG